MTRITFLQTVTNHEVAKDQFGTAGDALGVAGDA